MNVGDLKDMDWLKNSPKIDFPETLATIILHPMEPSQALLKQIQEGLRLIELK